MRLGFTIILLMFFFISGAQIQTISFDNEARNVENTVPQREVFDEGITGVQVNYSFEGAVVKSLAEGSDIFQKIYIKDFSHTQEPGLPSLPSHIDVILIPADAVATLQILNVTTLSYPNFKVYPALNPASDQYGATEPDFVIDTAFYHTNILYPSAPVKIREIVKYKGISLALVEVFPVQYNPYLHKIYVHSKIKYKLNFTHANTYINENLYSEYTLNILPNLVLNNGYLKLEIQNYLNSLNNHNQLSPDYLIVTHTDYLAAADSLAAWKEMQGFKTEIISSSSWTSAAIKSAVYAKYQAYSPKPDYLVLLGDNDKVPGQFVNTSSGGFSTDLYYACMDGSGDYIPDMAYGRISVSGSQQAMQVVEKIINYQRNPVIDNNFYSSALNCAYFQDAGGGYARRRFAQTAEEVAEYVGSFGYSVDRVYIAGTNVNPLHWNLGDYSAGEDIPNNLQKPAYTWDGNVSQINSMINSGRFYVLHRGNGNALGWGEPQYSTADMNLLNNGNKLPVVFSVNSLSGKYMDAECFSEKLLRMNNGGAVGVFAPGEVAYSGFNDGLVLGLFDALWPNPGLVPDFNTPAGVVNPAYLQHVGVYRMGDVKNQGLLKMVETWGGQASDVRYAFELYNYFGDPAMELFTANPQPISAILTDTIDCHNDTAVYISACNCDGMAALTVDGILVGKAPVVNGSAVITFSGVAGNKALVTITGRNRIPFVKSLVISGSCPAALFTVNSDKYCLDDSILITDLSSGAIVSRSWNFGQGANSVTFNGNSCYVHYSSAGLKTVTLTVTGAANNTVTYSRSFEIDQYCRYTVPPLGHITINKCSGKLYDDGGVGNYSGNTSGSVTIAPTGASSVTLTFNSFDFENSSDFLEIYDGPNTNSTLIGIYTGTSLSSNTQITSSSGSVTVRQFSDSYINHSGFELQWQCNYAGSGPQCDFRIDDSLNCDGVVDFHDYSTNGPVSWLWDFGDGTTSSQQHPTHIYSANGVYNVKLKVSNIFGSDSLVKQNAVSVAMPGAPAATDQMRCKAGTLNLSTSYNGPGTLFWYDSLLSSYVIARGLTFTTPVIASSKTYYAEIHENKSTVAGGKIDNNGQGLYYNANEAKYLVFDCYRPVKLHSVTVYSNQAKNRTFKLLNSGGVLLTQKNVYVPAGKQVVPLDFDIPVGINLRLAGPPAANFYVNTSSVSYPYKIGNAISIKRAGDSINSANNYYFFYDWQIIEGQCVSPKTAVNALVLDTLQPLADFAFVNYDPQVDFSFTGNYASSYYWDFGDGDFSLLKNPSHKYKSNGTFNVSLTVTNDCGQEFISKQVTVVSAGLQTNDKINSLLVYPVPAKGKLNLDFNSDITQAIEIEVVDLTGSVVVLKRTKINAGKNHVELNVSALAAGFYSLRIKGKNGIVIRRFTVD